MQVVPMSGGNWHTDPFAGKPAFTLSAALEGNSTYELQSSKDGTNWTKVGTAQTVAPFIWSTTVTLSDASVALRLVKTP